MALKALHSRSDLVELARKFAPTAACLRCLDLADTEIYGLFTFGVEAPDKWAGQRGWILRVGGIGKDWIIAIRPDAEKQTYVGFWPEQVPWLGWQGNSSGESNITNGDNPTAYAFLKMQARR